MLVVSGFVFNPLIAYGQIESDNTLPVNSDVIKNGINFKINGGTARGNSLFHSFQKFNIPTSGEAFFNNANSIENIFTRVTGGSISNIDGIIKANGSANLFLINPNGIIFGENAALNIGGSFLGTTANSIKFADGNNFSAVNPQAPPLLKINLPVGLQIGINPGKIVVKGKGHNLSIQDPIFSPIMGAGQNLTGLQVKSGKTLALLGGDIVLQKGVLAAREGRIELGAVNSGYVSLNPVYQGWKLNYDSINNFKNISLSQLSLVDTSGFFGGDIQLFGKQIKLQGGSLFINQNQGLLGSGTINIKASELLELSSLSSKGVIDTIIVSEAVNTGSGANINISTKNLSLQNGAGIYIRTFTDAKGGSLIADASNSVEIKGISASDPTIRSGIYTVAYNSGDAGDVTISAKSFRLTDGASISSSTFGSGMGGNVFINAQDSIDLIGFQSSFLLPSLIGSTSLNSGNAGNLTINSQQLSIRDGARVDSSTFASGNGGSVTVNATNKVEVTGNDLSLASFLISSAGTVPQNVQQLYRLPSLPTGDAGNVNINTPSLKVEGNSVVAAYNEGSGNAGTIKIDANTIFVNNQASIAAATENGNGGNILLKTRDLQLRNNSTITATAMGLGNGGNIDINTDTLVGLENSDITANAQNSFAGNVSINAQGVFGIRKREELTPSSDITASSQLGASFNGTVELNTPNIDPSKGVNELPVNIIDPTNQIASGCSANTGNRFIVTGRGGIPRNPSDGINQNIIWSDVRDLSIYPQQSNNINPATRISKQRKIIEATGFQFDEYGRIELVAKMTENSQKWQQMPNCGEI
ncbi:MAG: filamentous hemagglutinin N-terminal domain-containing protein [Cyanobacteria bacterium J06621_15]